MEHSWHRTSSSVFLQSSSALHKTEDSTLSRKTPRPVGTALLISARPQSRSTFKKNASLFVEGDDQEFDSVKDGDGE